MKYKTQRKKEFDSADANAQPFEANCVMVTQPNMPDLNQQRPSELSVFGKRLADLPIFHQHVSMQHALGHISC